MRCLNLSAVLVFFLSLSAFAEELGVKPAPDTSQVQWRGYLGVGSTFSPKTDIAIKYQSTTLVSASSDGKSSIGGAGELEAVFGPIFSASAIVDFAPYKYKDGSKSDSSINFMIMPKARTNFGLWAGFAFGVNHIGIGEPSSRSGTTTISFDDQSLNSLVLSPRIGIDFLLSPGVTLGTFAAYYTGSADTTVSVVDVSQGVNEKLKLEYTRSWWDAVVRVGFDL